MAAVPVGVCFFWFSDEFSLFLRPEKPQYMPKTPIFNPFRAYFHTGSYEFDGMLIYCGYAYGRSCSTAIAMLGAMAAAVTKASH